MYFDKDLKQDGDLSDEFLSEDVSPMCIKTLPNLSKNMGVKSLESRRVKTPIASPRDELESFGSEFQNLFKAGNQSSQNIHWKALGLKGWRSANGEWKQDNQLTNLSDAQNNSLLPTKGKSDRKISMNDDIKRLLQKAIKIRKGSNTLKPWNFSDLDEEADALEYQINVLEALENGDPEKWNNIVTMGDITPGF